MATYYTNLNNQRDATPMLYLREPLPSSQVETSVLPGNVMYMNPGSYSDTMVSNSQQQNNCITLPSPGGLSSNTQHHDILSNLGGGQIGEHDFTGWRGSRDGMLVMQPLDSHASLLQSGQNLQGQGLSLSLGTQIPSGIQMPAHPYRNPNLGLASFLSPNPSISGESGGRSSSRDEQSRNAEYALQSFPVGNQDANKAGLSQYGMSSVARTIPNSRYLKAAQQLLDEVVNVRKALKQPDNEKNKDTHENQIKKPDEGNEGSKNDASSNGKESEGHSQPELSHAERQDLQNKLTKLLSMLDEVDRRYKQYYHQMQIVVSSFDAIAGHGAAKPYTALALQTISRHFRCLRDAISGQIQATRKSLGEQDGSGNGKGIGIARLRYVDQQLRQQRALQQLGMMQQHAWRPQRGLPESSVSILRAWLFEHFLHPYPKDSDKIMLARQTGLTRSQVSNWFINARVRLWKPMVEEMYKEEIGDVDLDSISSSETAMKAKKGDAKSSEDRPEDLQQSSVHMDRSSSGQFLESKSDNVPDVEMVGTSGGVGPQNMTRGDFETEHGMMKLSGLQRPSLDDSGLFPDSIVHSESGNDRFMAAAAAAYHMSDMARYGGGSGVSLTLGLQHSEGGSLPLSGGTHHGFFTMRGDDIYSTAPSSVGTETTEFDGVDMGNQQQRFSSGHLLHDFVA